MDLDVLPGAGTGIAAKDVAVDGHVAGLAAVASEAKKERKIFTLEGFFLTRQKGFSIGDKGERLRMCVLGTKDRERASYTTGRPNS